MILVASAGKLKFWVLPNLDNEKTGFVESFKPFYSIEWVKNKKKKANKSSLKTKDDSMSKCDHSENGSSYSKRSDENNILLEEQENSCSSEQI